MNQRNKAYADALELDYEPIAYLAGWDAGRQDLFDQLRKEIQTFGNVSSIDRPTLETILKELEGK